MRFMPFKHSMFFFKILNATSDKVLCRFVYVLVLWIMYWFIVSQLPDHTLDKKGLDLGSSRRGFFFSHHLIPSSHSAEQIGFT